MKIKEILVEFEADQYDADGDDETSPYVEKMKNDLIDYLSSLSATGSKTPVATEKMVHFLRRQGYDVTPAQIVDMLDDTAFGADPDKIDMRGLEPRDAMRGRDPEFSKQKVSAMARQQIRKDL